MPSDWLPRRAFAVEDGEYHENRKDDQTFHLFLEVSLLWLLLEKNLVRLCVLRVSTEPVGFLY